MTQDKPCPNCQLPKDIQAITLNNICAVCGRDVGKGKSVTQDKQESWETWEMGFDKFRNFDGCEYGSDFHSRVKAFIRSLLAHQREEIGKEIGKLREKDKGWTGHPTIPDRFGEYEKIQSAKGFGYDSALDDVLAKLAIPPKKK